MTTLDIRPTNFGIMHTIPDFFYFYVFLRRRDAYCADGHNPRKNLERSHSERIETRLVTSYSKVRGDAFF